MKIKEAVIEPAALRLDDAAKYLSVSKATLRGLLQAGKIESFVVNKRGDRRIAIKALDKFMKDNASKGLGEAPLKANEARRKTKDKPITNIFDERNIRKDVVSDNEKLR